jgi:hypothetical protein
MNPRPRRPRALLLAVLGALVLALPACGGGGDNGENVIGSPRSTTPSTTPATTTTGTTTSSPQPGGSTQPEGGQGGETNPSSPGGGAPPPGDPYRGQVDPGSGSTPGERFENYCRQNPNACGN